MRNKSFRILRSTKLLLSFFTRIHVKVNYSDLSEIAEVMWFIPVVGFILGLLTSLFAAVVYTVLPITLAAVLTLGFSIYLTGAHHTDGLLDFGDGIMAHGSAEKKIEIMHDVSIGAGGFILGLIIYIILVFSLMSVSLYYTLAIMVSFMGSRISMLYACAFGRSANTKMADSFIKLNGKKEAIKSTLLLIVLIILALVLLPIISLFQSLVYNLYPAHLIFPFSFKNAEQFLIIMGFAIIIAVLIPYLSAKYMIKVANRHFNGLTGDSLGALNEITLSLMLIISIVVFSTII